MEIINTDSANYQVKNYFTWFVAVWFVCCWFVCVYQSHVFYSWSHDGDDGVMM